MEKIIRGRGVVGGQAEGQAMVCPEGLTGWGGLDPETGNILEIESPYLGQSIKDKILVIPGSHGSNGWSCYFTATHVAGSGPKAVVVNRIDSSSGVALACMQVPAVVDFAPEDNPCVCIEMGDWVVVDGDSGMVKITKK